MNTEYKLTRIPLQAYIDLCRIAVITGENKKDIISRLLRKESEEQQKIFRENVCKQNQAT